MLTNIPKYLSKPLKAFRASHLVGMSRFVYLNAVDALVVVVIVHWIVWREKDAFVVYD